MKTELKFGLITGFGVCMYVLLEYFLGFHNTRLEIGRYSGYFSIIIPIITIYLALKEKRDTYQGGTLRFGQGVKIGLVISVVTAVITTLFLLLYNNLINPGWMDLAMEWEKNQMIAAGSSEEEIAAKVAAFKAMSSGATFVVQNLLLTIASGLVVTVIISAIMRKKPAQS